MDANDEHLKALRSAREHALAFLRALAKIERSVCLPDSEGHWPEDRMEARSAVHWMHEGLKDFTERLNARKRERG